MKQATLCILVKEENQGEKEILLAMKKRGFGKGRWNGIGGKVDLEKGDKSIVGAAIRETQEEIGVKVKDMEKVALLNFRFPYIPEEQQNKWNQDVHVFLVRGWDGEPIETEEMAPKWFKLTDIPFEKMWDDDKYWLPHIVEGRKIEGRFVFKKGEVIVQKNIKIVKTI
jgi:8-oxo-dGTP pyrophosphatase MutT (NUDIX family)